MSHPIFKFVMFILIISITGCHNVNKCNPESVFVKYSIDSKEYRNELAKQLQLNSDVFNYTFDKYFEEHGKEYMRVQIQNNDFEATANVLVRNWYKIEGIKRARGLGYRGAELKGLKLHIEESRNGATYIYKDLQKIVD